MSSESAGIKLLAAVIGFWILMRALNRDATGRTLVDHILGQSGSANAALTPPGSAANPIGTPNAKGQVNPVPGSTASRLDQGIDLTGKSFVSPYAGTVVVSEASDPGWAGGGYIAIESATNPNQIEYFAEGITPLVQAGQKVKAGQGIGRAVSNPYNLIVGNIETGPANPRNPYQPLAQVASNPAQVVRNFAAWLRSLGGPSPTSTSNAGRA
jgi:biotin carboxyl carrier protein